MNRIRDHRLAVFLLLVIVTAGLGLQACSSERTDLNSPLGPKNSVNVDGVIAPQPVFDLPKLISQDFLNTNQHLWLTSSRELTRMTGWAAEHGYTVAVDEAVLLKYDRPGLKIVNVPLYDDAGEPVWGAVSFLRPFTSESEAMAYVVFPDPSTPQIAFYGGSGSEILNTYDGDGWLQSSEEVSTSSACGKTWKEFKEWLDSPDDPADLPWWLDILCGGVCFDAIFGTHNPWSISGCIHCLGAYIAGCIKIEPAPTTVKLNTSF
jgi:hypothetical protein